MKQAKAKLLDKYSPYQKAGGGQVSDTEYEAVMKAEKAGKKTMIDKPVKGTGATSNKERKYPSGMTDSDIDKIISSKEVKESMSSFEDKKRGGKVGK
jgi:cell division protein FtsI/penicillin-binding protein 2